MVAASSDRAIRARILLGAIRARRVAAVMLFGVAAVAIAAAAIGPMFLQSADDSVLSNAISAASPGAASLTVISNGGVRQMNLLSAAVASSVRIARGLLAGPIFTAIAGSEFVAPSGQAYGADVLARTQLCQHLQIVRGVCPNKVGQVALSERSARAAGLQRGSEIRLTESHQSASVEVTVTGIYADPASVENAYWEGINYFSYGTGSSAMVQLDPLIASFGGALAMDSVATPQLGASIGLRADSGLHGRSALLATVSEIRSRLFVRYGLVLSSDIGVLVANAAHEEDLMTPIVLTFTLELVLLALLILFTLGRSTAGARLAEAEFARRHGFPRIAFVALATGEPSVLIIAALPVGLLLAWGALALVARTLFVSGTPVSPGILPIIAGLGASLLGVLATGLASYQLWQRPTAPLDRRRRSVEVTIDAFAVALALAGLLSLASKGSLDGSQANPLASLAPGLLAIGAGIIGLRIAAFAVRLLISRTTESARVPWYLALRQIGRRPIVLRQLLPLTTATALVILAVGGFARASSNRALVADFDAGSARVVDVTVSPGVNLINAVDKADPSGRQAMAAALYESPSGELLAVDSARLATVARWPSGLTDEPLTTLAKRLAPTGPIGVVFSGDRLRLTVDVAAKTPPIQLGVTAFDEVYQDQNITYIGPIEPGRHSYVAVFPGSCGTSCRLLSLSPSWKSSDETYSGSVRFVVDQIAELHNAHWRSVPFGSGQRGTWIAQPSSLRVEPPEGLSGVAFEIPPNMLGYGGLLLSPVDLPARVPALVTPELVTVDPPTPPEGELAIEGLDGNPLSIAPLAVVATLPLVGNGGALIDFGLAQRAITSNEVDTTFQVWLSSSAGPNVLRHLRALGVRAGSSTLASSQLSSLNHGGIALAYDLALLVSPIAVLLALGAVIFGAVADETRRRRELASMAVAGVPSRITRRSLSIENAIVLTIALTIGVAVGIGATALALTSLPEFVSGTGGVPIPTGVPFVPEIMAIALFCVVFIAVAQLTTRLVVHRATNRRLGRFSR